MKSRPASSEPVVEEYLHITPMPDRPDEAMIHLPEFTYLDTQVWSVDIGIPAEALPALRAAIDAYDLDEDGFSPTAMRQRVRRELYTFLNACEDFTGCPAATADTLTGVVMCAVQRPAPAPSAGESTGEAR